MVESRAHHLVSAACVAALLVAGCGSGSTAGTHTHRSAVRQTPLTATQQIIFTGVTASGLPSLSITQTIAGSCWEGSVAADRSDAYRCSTSGDDIYDPCFALPGMGFVVCPTDGGPWDGTAIEMTLTKPLPVNTAADRGTSGLPWAIELANGARCTAQTGTTNVVDGMSGEYTCSNGDYLYGKPDRTEAIWTIYAGTPNASQIEQQRISKAWF